MDPALGAVDVEDHPLRRRACRRMLKGVRVQASQPLVISLLGKGVRLEPVERGGERDARVSPLPRGQHPKRRVLGQSLRVVRVLVAGQAAVDGLAKEIRQGELGVASGAWISRCRWISVLKPRRSSNSRGNSSPASEVTVAPWNSTRSWGLNHSRTGPDFASPIGWCPPRQRGAPENRVSCECDAIMT